ncbi:MAG: MFS transporter, partial [Gammaproteobacteria bacterium]
NPDDIPLLFLAAPLTGLIVQPIIGYLSDRTWHPKWGRRRPYFLIGAVLSSIALIIMPNSSALWMAAGLLWVLDVFGNVAMEPFRAFVADKLPDSQLNRGFVMQSLMIGLGGSIASALPWLLKNWFGLQNTAAKGVIAENVRISFYLGAFFFLAAVLYTVFTSKEYPPTDLSLKYNVFGATSDTDPRFGDGKDFAGLTLAFYNVVTFAFAFILPSIADRLGRKLTHSICLLAGAVGLISVAFVTDKDMLFVCMTGVGIAWASILSMPYAMLGGVLPAGKIGIYMGIFNFFIVLPEIIASLGFKWIMNNVLNNDRLLAVQVGGYLMILAALICFFFIKEKKSERVNEPLVEEMKITEERPI